MARGKFQKPKSPPPLKPHFEDNDYGRGVVVTRLPKDASEVDKRKALNESHKLAKLHSNPDPYW